MLVDKALRHVRGGPELEENRVAVSAAHGAIVVRLAASG
jgi:hypothetical protein